MADIPLAQLVVALATYWTVVLTVLLFPGAETDTPAKALDTRAAQINGTHCFMYGILLLVIERGDAGKIVIRSSFSGEPSCGDSIGSGLGRSSNLSGNPTEK
jgi:hypothetical protein